MGPPWTPGSDPPRPRRTLPGAITVLLLAVAVLVGLGLGHSVWRSGSTRHRQRRRRWQPGPAPLRLRAEPLRQQRQRVGLGSGLGRSAPSNTSAIAAKVSPALVDIDTDLSYRGEAAGTGIVLTSDGLVAHQQPRHLRRHPHPGDRRRQRPDLHRLGGRLRPGSTTSPWSSCKRPAACARPPSATPPRLSVGDRVVGLGNAGGVGGTPSSAGGTVTALDQSITATDEGDGTSEQLTGLIQVNANIQPGDSGGALVDTNGHVIGIDTAASAGFNFQTAGGQGFAIPINQAIGIARQIQPARAPRRSTSAPPPSWGCWSTPAASSGPGPPWPTPCRAVRPPRPDWRAGDTITSLAGHSVDKPSTLTNLILGYHPGDKVEVGWSDTSGQIASGHGHAGHRSGPVTP